MSETWESWQDANRYAFKDILFQKRRREVGGSAARIVINRPESRNSFTRDTIREMLHAIQDCNDDPDIGVVILRGVGDKAFSSGGDVRWESGRQSWEMFADVPPNHVIRFSNHPVIAAVAGYAIGGGNHLAYTCDFTIAAENAVFGQVGPRVGSPADGYIVRYLIRVVGAKRARAMWMTGFRIDAATALDWGLVNAVVPIDQLDDEVDRWCESILEASPTCIRILKATFDREIDEMAGDVRRTAAMLAPGYIDGPEAKEAQSAFVEKRRPNFWGGNGG